jgi:hypothetical protein
MAIKNSLGQIIGVIQLINKFDDLVSFSTTSLGAHRSNYFFFFLIYDKNRFSPRTMRTLLRLLPFFVAWV